MYVEFIMGVGYLRRTKVLCAAFFYLHVTRKKAAEKTFIQEMYVHKNVNEIDTST